MPEFFRIRNFEKFQHYHDRRPPWIKLYRDLLDDPRLFDLIEADRYLLIGLFIVASQHENLVPLKLKWLQSQLRTARTIPIQTLVDTGWLEYVAQDASKMLHDSGLLAERYPSRARGETETETETPIVPSDFERFWEAYPKKRAKGSAIKAWTKNGHPGIERILEVIAIAKRSPDWIKEGGQYVPYPASWLNGKCWDDDYGPPPQAERKVVY